MERFLKNSRSIMIGVMGAMATLLLTAAPEASRALPAGKNWQASFKNLIPSIDCVLGKKSCSVQQIAKDRAKVASFVTAFGAAALAIGMQTYMATRNSGKKIDNSVLNPEQTVDTFRLSSKIQPEVAVPVVATNQELLGAGNKYAAYAPADQNQGYNSGQPQAIFTPEEQVIGQQLLAKVEQGMPLSDLEQKYVVMLQYKVQNAITNEQQKVMNMLRIRIENQAATVSSMYGAYQILQ